MSVMLVVVVMFMPVLMRVTMVMVMMVMLIVVPTVSVIIFEVDVELHTRDTGLLLACDVEVIAAEFELGEFAFEFARVHAQINQCADKHVTADAAKNV